MGGDFKDGIYRKKYRKKGEFPNLAVFSFDQIDGVFMDYMSWHVALNAYQNGRTVTPYERRMILKPSWTRRRWLQAALKDSLGSACCSGTASSPCCACLCTEF